MFFLAVPAVGISDEGSGADVNTTVHPTESSRNNPAEAGEVDNTVLDIEEKGQPEQTELPASKIKLTKPDELPNFDNEEHKALKDINSTLKSAVANLNKERSLPTYQKFLIGSGVLGFLIAVCNLIVSFVHRSEDKAKSIIDDFWLREVIIPRAIEPIEEKILNNKFRYQDLKSLKAVEIEELISCLDELRYSISVTDIISSDLMAALEELLDELSITVATRSMPAQVYSAHNYAEDTHAVGDPFFHCYKAMLFELIQAHKGLNVKQFFSV